jgi:predicted HicB family RNase H-like nuclease
VKVVKEGVEPEKIPYTQRLRPDTHAQLKKAAKAAGMKVNPFVEAILEQVLNDPKFVLKVRG